MAFLRGSKYWVDFKLPDGTRVNKSLKTSDLLLAEAREAELRDRLLAELEESLDQKPAEYLTLSEALEFTWTAKWKKGKNGFRQYNQVKAIIELIGDVPLTRFVDDSKARERTGVRLVEYIRATLDEGRQAATVDRYMTALKTLLNTCARRYPCEYLQGRVPHVHIENPKNARERILYLDEEAELLALAEKRDPEFAEFLVFLLDTGFRPGEALKLNWFQHIRTNEGIIYVGDTKTSKGRSILMTERVKDILIRRKRGSDGGRVWPKNWNVSMLDRRFIWYRIEMGLEQDKEFSLYMMRHTCLTRLMAAGNDSALVQLWSGHSNVAMLQRYTHLAAGALTKLRGSLDNVNNESRIKLYK